jgi:hypothetical protein
MFGGAVMMTRWQVKLLPLAHTISALFDSCERKKEKVVLYKSRNSSSFVKTN